MRNCGLCGTGGSQKWLLLAMNEMKPGPGELTLLPSPSTATRREVTPWPPRGTRPGQSITILECCQTGPSHPRGAESAGFWESTCSFLGEKQKTNKRQILVLIDPSWHSEVWERGSAAWGFLQRAHVGWESCLQAGKMDGKAQQGLCTQQPGMLLAEFWALAPHGAMLEGPQIYRGATRSQVHRCEPLAWAEEPLGAL